MQEPRTQFANIGGIIPLDLAFGFHDADPLQRDENLDRGMEYSGMYS